MAETSTKRLHHGKNINETERVASNGGPPRKYYRPSREGRRALAAGIAEWQAARDSLDAALGLVEEEVS